MKIPESKKTVIRIKLRLLGAPRLISDTGQTRPLDRAEAGLLGLLAMEGEQRRHRVASMFWPDNDSAQALNNLRQRLFRLKELPFAPLVFATKTSLRLMPDVSHDLDNIENQLRQDPQAATGELLTGFDQIDNGGLIDWVLEARERCNAIRNEALRTLADEREAEQRFEDALLYAQRLVAADPLAEHGHRRLMRLHYRLGDRARALAAFRACSAVLAAELDGRKPSAQTLELAEVIEHSDALQASIEAQLPTSSTNGPLTACVIPPSAPAQLPPALLRPPTLIARENDWRRMSHAWSRGQLIVVCGEPGVGKSRLAGDFARSHGDVAVCKAQPGDTTLPYALLSRLLRLWATRYGEPKPGWIRGELAHLLPELGPVSFAQADGLRLRQALALAVSGWLREGLSAMVIDDLQFADPASLACLQDLAVSYLGTPGIGTEPGPILRTMFMVRSAEKPATFSTWLGSLKADSTLILELEPLRHPELVRMLNTLSVPGLDAQAWAAPLWRHTGGNPLFVLETLVNLLLQGRLHDGARTTALPSPQGVSKLIERRLMNLSAGGLRLAQVAAIAGLDFDAELAGAVLQCHILDLSRDWSELEGAQILCDGAFAHDLIFEAALRTVPANIAQSIHRQVAQILEARVPPQALPPPARLAEHWWAAQEWSAAASCFMKAAAAVATQARRDEELRLLDRAAAACDRAGLATEAFESQLRAVDALIAVGSVGDALRRLDSLDTQAATDHQRLGVALLQAKAAMTTYEAERADPRARQAIDLAMRLGDDARLLEARNLLASSLGLQGRGEEALSLLSAQEQQMPEAASPGQLSDFYGTYGYVLGMTHKRRAAIAQFEEAFRIADDAGNYSEALTFLSNLSGLQSQLGQMEQAMNNLMRAHRIRLRLGQVDGIPVVAHDCTLGMVAMSQGRYAQALAALERAVLMANKAGAPTWLAVAQGQLANLYLILGNPARAGQQLQPLPAGMRVAQRVSRAVIEARLLRAKGRDPCNGLRQALGWIEQQPLAPERIVAELALASSLANQEGLSLCRTAMAHARSAELDGLVMSARVREIALLSAVGETSTASCAAAEAWTHLCNVPCWPTDLYRGEIFWILMGVFRNQRRSELYALVRAEAQRWIATSTTDLPKPLVRSFLHGNPFNESLLAA